MDPLSITASVGALTATCLSTCKKLSDLADSYQDVPVVVAMICSETTVVSIALSELQKNILQRQDLAQAWASRTDVLVAFETALTGCMIVFSCLEAETRQLQSQTPNSSGMRVWAKLRVLWNQDRLKELLSALRGQQSSINFLIQILEINTLSDIERNIRDNKSKIQKPASEAQSLRSDYPSVRMESQSIFDSDITRLSLFAVDPISAIAPSVNFDFDDVVLNSQAYRRVYARAQLNTDFNSQAHMAEDIGLHITPRDKKYPIQHSMGQLSPTSLDADDGSNESGFLEENDIQVYDHNLAGYSELSARYAQASEQLKLSLRDKMSNPATLEVLSTKFFQCFTETFDEFLADVKSKSHKRRDSVGSVIKAPQAAHLDMLPGLGGEGHSHPDYRQI